MTEQHMNYLLRALEGACRELRETQPGSDQARALYGRALRLTCLAQERGHPEFVATIERELVVSGLQMQNGGERWTRQQIEKQVSNGIRGGLNKSAGPVPDTPVAPRVGRFIEGEVLPVQRGETDRFVYTRRGLIQLVKVRYNRDPKYLPFFRVTAPEGGTAWTNIKPDGFPMLPFNADEIGNPARLEAPIFITEGERDARSLSELNMLATTFGGSGAFPGDAVGLFRDRDIVVVGDNDQAGRDHVTKLAGLLDGKVRSVRTWIPSRATGETPPGYDLSDWINERTPLVTLEGDILALCSPAPLVAAAEPLEAIPTPVAKKVRFPITRVSGQTPMTKHPWLVEGIIPACGITLFYGESGIGKSFAVIDLALAVQNGSDWGGRQTEVGEVVYIAAEDASGIRDRLSSTMRHRDLPDASGCNLIESGIDLSRNSNEVAVLVDELKAELVEKTIRLVIVDTLQMSMGAADENSSSDATAIIRNCRKVVDAFGCTVLLVHHSGKDGSKKARGSSAFSGAADSIIQMTGSGPQKVLTITKQKNGPGGLKLHAVLAPTNGGLSCILEVTSPWSSSGARHEKQASDNAGDLISMMRSSMEKSGKDRVLRADLLQSFIDLPGNPKRSPGADSKAFNRLIEREVELGHVEADRTKVWFSSPRTCPEDMGNAVLNASASSGAITRAQDNQDNTL